MRPEPRRWPERAFLAALFALGALHWVVLLSSQGGLGPVPTVEDWGKEFRHYDVLRQAVQEGRPPLFLSRPILAGRKLLAVPELNLFPHTILLAWLPISAFVVLDALLLYAAGCAGLLCLRRRLGLSAVPFASLFLVSFLNGHLTAHMAVGHSMWAAHFLLPFFMLSVLDLLEGRGRAPHTTALTLFAVLLRGGFHLFVWCVLLLLLLVLFRAARVRPAAAALAWTAAAGAFRLAPGVFLARHREQPFLSGFASPADLWHALVSIRDAAAAHRGGLFGQLGWWEYDTYVGPAGLAWLLVFGVALAWRHAVLAAEAERALHAALAVLALLAMGDSYLVLNLSPIPLLNAERVSARLLVLPLLFVALLAAARMERHWGRWSRRARAAAAGFLAALGAGLLAHSWAWRVARLQQILPARRGLLNVELASVPAPLAGSDLAYVLVVALSTLVSLGSVALLIARVWRARAGAGPPSTAA